MSIHHPRQVRARRYRLRGACAALAAVAALIVAVPAEATQSASSGTTCRITATGAHFSIRGVASGSNYQVVARGMSCSVARTWMQRLARRTSPATGGPFGGGPAGFTCTSFSVAASGDKLIYAGACKRSGGRVFFGWAAKP